jgi:hypothetical protein
MDSTGALLRARCAGKEIYAQASLRHVRRAAIAIIGDLPDDIITWTMLIAANA